MSTNSTIGQLIGCEGGDRSAVGIAWSCIAVIFACAWKAVHPDIPSKQIRKSKWKLMWRRICMTLWTVFVPELVVLRAADEYFLARQVSAIHGQPEQHTDRNSGERGQWTRVHSFFLSMGGFCTTYLDGDEQRLYTIRPKDIRAGQPFHWPNVEEDVINDKSKGDMIVKALVVTQTAWFVIQLVARAVEGLAITELEIMTLAYSLICAILYSLWWNKPYDVQEPISPPGSQFEGSAPLGRGISDSAKNMPIRDLVAGGWIWALDETIFGPHHVEFEWDGRDIAVVLFFASGTLLGCIHCIAWNFQFPTITERLLWIISSLITAAAPLAVPLLILCLLGLTFVFAVVAKGISVCLVGLGVMRESRTFSDWRDDFRDNMTLPLMAALFWVTIYAYTLARITLIIQSFVLLRHLSPSAMQSISWVDFLPHV